MAATTSGHLRCLRANVSNARSTSVKRNTVFYFIFSKYNACLLLLVVYVILSVIGFVYVYLNWGPLPNCGPQNVLSRSSEPARKTRDLNGKSAKDGEKVACQPTPHNWLKKIMGPAFNPRYMSIEKPPLETADEKPSDKSAQSDQHYARRHHKRLEAFHVHSEFSRIIYNEPVERAPSDLKKAQYEINSRFEAKFASAMDKIPSVKPDMPFKPDFESQTTEKLDPKKLDADFEQVEPLFSDERDRQPESPSNKFLKSVSPVKRRWKRGIRKGFPWACESRVEWIDLGANHFPRFLRSVICTSPNCWFGHFRCRGKAFTMKILRRRKDSCVASDDDVTVSSDVSVDANAAVPEQLQEQWVFEERAVTSCCECAI